MSKYRAVSFHQLENRVEQKVVEFIELGDAIRHLVNLWEEEVIYGGKIYEGERLIHNLNEFVKELEKQEKKRKKRNPY